MNADQWGEGTSESFPPPSTDGPYRMKDRSPSAEEAWLIYRKKRFKEIEDGVGFTPFWESDTPKSIAWILAFILLLCIVEWIL